MDSKILREATLAYQAVYDENLRRELTEEQIWEEVESWVNSLLEEGYDLSEYTWEEMYEEYINEQGRGASVGSNPNVSQNPIAKAIRGDGPSPTMTPAQRNQARMRPIPSAKPQVSNLGSNYRGQELAAAAKARASQVSTPRQGTAGGPTVGGNTPIGPAKTPATKPAAKPAPTSTAKPAPTTPPKPAPTTSTTPAAKPGTQAAGPESIKPKTPNPLMKDMPKGPGSMAAPTPAPKKFDIRDRDPRARANFDPRYDKKPINQSFDLFDVVLGHLLDEGYADNEDAALAIMANMSEEWKQSIVEMSPAMQNLLSKPSNRLDGKRSPALPATAPPSGATGKLLTKPKPIIR